MNGERGGNKVTRKDEERRWAVEGLRRGGFLPLSNDRVTRAGRQRKEQRP